MIVSTVTGHLGQDAELRYSASGSPFLRFSVASNGRQRTAEGEWQDRTEWCRVTILGQRAESLAQHLTKGASVTVVGRLEARPWTDQQGQLRAGLEVVAHEISFSSPRQAEQQQPRPDQQRAAGYPSRGPASPQAVNRQAARRQANDYLEDLPF